MGMQMTPAALVNVVVLHSVRRVFAIQPTTTRSGTHSRGTEAGPRTEWGRSPQGTEARDSEAVVKPHCAPEPGSDEEQKRTPHTRHGAPNAGLRARRRARLTVGSGRRPPEKRLWLVGCAVLTVVVITTVYNHQNLAKDTQNP